VAALYRRIRLIVLLPRAKALSREDNLKLWLLSANLSIQSSREGLVLS